MGLAFVEKVLDDIEVRNNLWVTKLRESEVLAVLGFSLNYKGLFAIQSPKIFLKFLILLYYYLFTAEL